MADGKRSNVFENFSVKCVKSVSNEHINGVLKNRAIQVPNAVFFFFHVSVPLTTVLVCHCLQEKDG